MSSKRVILSHIRAGKPASQPLPEVPMFRFEPDAKESFKKYLSEFDGNVIEFGSRSEALSWLEDNIGRGRRKVYSAVEGFTGNFELNSDEDLHKAGEIDVCVANGLLGVGETGSVWVTDESLGTPAAALMSTDLYMILDSKDIVGGVHDAYARIEVDDYSYGSFYTGPSATADIEAVRVTGAQGEISLTVLLCHSSA